MNTTTADKRPRCQRSSCGNLARARSVGAVQPLYCSDACRNEARRERRRSAALSGPEPKTELAPSAECLREGCPNPPRAPRKYGSQPLYCSPSCAKKERQNRRDRRLRYAVHGSTLDDYDRLFMEQQGRCAICGTSEPGGHNNTRFAFDHSHETDEARGLLCYLCNVGLGSFQDDQRRLQAAVEYLQRHNSRSRARPESAMNP